MEVWSGATTDHEGLRARKSYFAFQAQNKISRAVNKGLFSTNTAKVQETVTALIKGDFKGITPAMINSALYSIVISFCCSIDLLKSSDQKTPETFFEYFIVHWFSRMLGIQPKREIAVLNLDMETKLPTDIWRVLLRN